MTNTVQNLQVVVFSPASSTLDAEGIYNSVFGEPASSTQRNKFPQPQAPFLSIASGEKNNCIFNVQINEGRIDFFVRSAPRPSHDLELESLDADSAFNDIIKNYKTVSTSFKDTYRLAIVTNSGAAFESEQQSVDAFCQAIGIEALGENVVATDLNFQRNKRSTLEGGAVINFLERHNVDLLVLMQGNMPPPFAALIPGYQPTPQKMLYVLNKMRDVNTVPDGRTFSEEEQIETLNNLYSVIRG